MSKRNNTLIYPLTRHFQRYEYIVQKGYVTDRVVLDAGCGTGYGLCILATKAKDAVGIDLAADESEAGTMIELAFQELGVKKKARVLKGDILTATAIRPVDIVTAVEIIEHMSDPERFVDKLAELGRNVFVTTPLVAKTQKTRNKEHVREYSAGDFDALVSRRFSIQEKRYQKADMSIVKKAVPQGDSYDYRHVVQMVYAQRRDT